MSGSCSENATKSAVDQPPKVASSAMPVLVLTHEGEDTAGMTPPLAPLSAKPKITKRRKAGRFGLWLLLSLVLVVSVAGFGVLALTGKPIRLPVWVVAEAEARLNKALPLGENSISLGGIEIRVDKDWAPRLRLNDLRLAQIGGATILALPEARVAFDPVALTRFELRPSKLTLSGAQMKLRRNADGLFDLDIGAGAKGAQLGNLAAILDSIDAIFALPALSSLHLINAEALSLTLQDARAGRVWQVGDGRMTLENREDDVAVELGLSLLNEDGGPAQAVLSFISQKANSAARIRATVDRVAARDIAVQAPPLAWLGVLDAPISGRFSTALDAQGSVQALDASLTIDKGALHPSAETRPVAFDRAAIGFGYDPSTERITLNEATVESKSLRLSAGGHVYVPGVAKGTPQEFLAQIRFDQVKVDPEGLFTEPVNFSAGALDLRLRLDPFRIDLGQLSLLEEGRHLQAKGKISADPKGWNLAVDIGLDAIAHDRLLALWPVSVVPKTRGWLADNVQEGQLFDVKAALRVAPDVEPRLSLGYEFADADVRFLKTLPPIKRGFGYATIEGNSYTMVLDKGEITPPIGGRIDMAGSVFSVLDILQRPAQAEVNLKTDSSLTAALSLLDEPPFGFLTKAGREVELAEGRAQIRAVLRLPLVQKVKINDVAYQVQGVLSNVRSDILVPGKILTAEKLDLTAGPSGMTISGAGKIGKVPFDATYSQGFTPETKGKSTVEGRVELSPLTVSEFGLGLPDGMVSGVGTAQIKLDLTKGEAAKLSLKSDLANLRLSLPEVGWSKPASTKGQMIVAARLGIPPVVDRFEISAAGLTARGAMTIAAGGGLDTASFDSFTVNGWLDAGVKLTGHGKGKAVGVMLTDGTLDLRRMTLGKGKGQGAEGGTALDVRLERVIVSEGIALTGFSGSFSPKGGFNGQFTAKVNGVGAVNGTVAPTRGGSAVRITAEDAGAVLASAGIFSNARGGSMDLQLVPTGVEGNYNGQVTARNIRVRNAPALAELLSAISVVGILDQLRGDGLLFNDSEAVFRLTPAAIEVTRGSAVGASMGVSMAGIYQIGNKRLDMQGVISPIYLLNGIGAVLTRRGEGLFGFNYRLSGTSDEPSVSVNPLSILTPGMFRDLFRRPAPTIADSP